MARKLIWIKSDNFQGFGCSQCSWMFKSTGVLVGKSLDKMKEDYEPNSKKNSLPTFACTQSPQGQRTEQAAYFLMREMSVNSVAGVRGRSTPPSSHLMLTDSSPLEATLTLVTVPGCSN